MRAYRATVEAVKRTSEASRLVCRWDYSDRTFEIVSPEHVPLARDIIIGAEGFAEGEPINPQYLGLAPHALLAS